jgi:predicted DNA-binding ribbon-helix-helix protein
MTDGAMRECLAPAGPSATQHVTLSVLVTQIDGTREQSNLSSEIRVFVLRHFRLVRWPGHGLAAKATSFSAAGSS